MLNTIILSALSFPLLLIGIMVLVGKEKALFFKAESSVKTISVAERIIFGFVLCFIGGLLAVSAWSIFFSGNPYWLLEKVFGIIT